MSDRPWYVDLFGDDYLRVWAPVLRVEASYGGLDGSALTLDSRRLVTLSRKP